MSDFDTLNATAAAFNDTTMGESFTYTSTGGTLTSGLTGVFNQVATQFGMEDFSIRQTVSLVCVSSKTQWGSVVPAVRGVIAYGSINYTIEDIDGLSSAGEPCYSLTLKKLT